MYLNDIESYFTTCNVNSLTSIENISFNELDMFIKLYVLLYADDTIIVAESPHDLQIALNAFQEYCILWKLKVNLTKTKVVIFFRRKVRRQISFKLFDVILEVQDSYSYLGVLFKYNGNFDLTRKKLADHGHKLLYNLLRKIRNITLPIDLQIQLFDSLVLPAITYGCEIWGYEKLTDLEKINLRFCKNILNLRNTTPNFMVYGELGRTSLDVIINRRMICFWNNLLSDRNKLSNKLYHILYHLSQSGRLQCKWISHIKSILDNTGLSYIWIQQLFNNPSYIKTLVSQKLKDIFIHNWFNQIETSSRGEFYGLFKTQHILEPYLLKLYPNERRILSKFRCCNVKIPIETGRWHNIPKENRICLLCNNHIGNEFHYLFICTHPNVVSLRNRYIPTYYINNPSLHKMKGMIMISNISLHKRLSFFIKRLSKLL